MLSRTILSDAELKISQSEREALLLVLQKLEKDEIPHVCEKPKFAIHKEYIEQPGGFNMSYIYSQHDCGTSGCILGWALTLHPDRDNIFDGRKRTDAIQNLFGVYGNDVPQPTSDITPTQAAAAIRNFLATGHANWAEATA